MYAACSFATGMVVKVSSLVQFARLWTWVAVAVWVLVLAATLWQPVPILGAMQSLNGDRTRDEAESG